MEAKEVKKMPLPSSSEAINWVYILTTFMEVQENVSYNTFHIKMNKRKRRISLYKKCQAFLPVYQI